MSIQSIDRALAILFLFSAAKTQLGITEIGRSLGLNNPTAHGLVKTLVENGFLEQDPDTKKYSLSVRNFELGYFYLGSSKVYQAGAVATHRLAQKTGLTTRLAIRDKDSVVIILTVYSRAEKFQYVQIGPRIPHYCTGLGKGIIGWIPHDELTAYFERVELRPYTHRTITDRKRLLEDLENARMRGYATDRQELITDVVCAGAPIFDQSGKPIAALSISSDSQLLALENLSELTDKLIQTTKEISYSMGYNPIITPLKV